MSETTEYRIELPALLYISVVAADEAGALAQAIKVRDTLATTMLAGITDCEYDDELDLVDYQEEVNLSEMSECEPRIFIHPEGAPKIVDVSAGAGPHEVPE